MDEQWELRDDWSCPDPARLSPAHARYDRIVELHDDTVAQNRSTYIDPSSGFSVFTARFLARRNYCCESGCRHCPYVSRATT